jgi:hypothetical protein
MVLPDGPRTGQSLVAVTNRRRQTMVHDAHAEALRTMLEAYQTGLDDDRASREGSTAAERTAPTRRGKAREVRIVRDEPRPR